MPACWLQRGSLFISSSNELAIQDTVAISQMFCISPYTCQSVFTVCCKWRSIGLIWFFFFLNPEKNNFFLRQSWLTSLLLPLFDRPMKEIQCQVGQPIRAGYELPHIRVRGKKREVLPLAMKTSLCCPQTEYGTGEGKAALQQCVIGPMIN